MCFRSYKAECKRRERKAIKDKSILTRQITNQKRSNYYKILCPECQDKNKDEYCPKCKSNYNISVKEAYKKRKLGQCDKNCKENCCAYKKKQKLTLPGSSNENRSNYVKGPQGMSLTGNATAASAAASAAAASAAAAAAASAAAAPTTIVRLWPSQFIVAEVHNI